MVDNVDGVGGRATKDDARRRPRGIRGALALPLAIVSTIAVTLGIAQPAEAAPHQVKRQPKAKAQSGATTRVPSVAATAVPAEIVVADGDTVSGIAERYGLSTAEVLAQNGLSWSSLIFPGNGSPCRAAPRTPPPRRRAPPPRSRSTPSSPATRSSGIAAQYGTRARRRAPSQRTESPVAHLPGRDDRAADDGPHRGHVAAPPAPAAPAPRTAARAEARTSSWPATPCGTWPSATTSRSPQLERRQRTRRHGHHPPRPDAHHSASGRRAPRGVGDGAAHRRDARERASSSSRSGAASGCPTQGIVVALAAAAQESSLRNLHSRRSRLARPVPATAERGLGHRRRGARPGARDDGVLRRAPPTRIPDAPAGCSTSTGWEAMTVTRPRRPCS